MEQMKDAMKEILGQLHSGDYFNMMKFSGGTGKLFSFVQVKNYIQQSALKISNEYEIVYSEKN